MVAELTQTDTYRAYAALLTELMPFFDAADPNGIVALNKFRFSEPSRQKLIKVFGHDHPLHLKGTRKKNGDAELVFSMDAWHDDVLEVSELTGKAEFGRKVRQKSLVVKVPFVRSNDRLGSGVEFSQLQYAENVHKGSLGLWLGLNRFTMGRLHVRHGPSNTDWEIGDTSFRLETKPHGNRVDVAFESAIDSVRWPSDGLGRIHLAARVADLDGKLLATYVAGQRRVQTSDLAQSALAAVIQQSNNAMLRAMFRQGLTIDISDLSVQYHGMTAHMDGRIAWPPGLDLSAPEQMLTQMALRFNVSLPMAMVDMYIRNIVGTQLRAAAQPGQVISPQQLDKAAKEQLASMLATGLNNGLLTVENNTLLSTIEFKSSQLFLNGHVLPTGNANP
ncbi:DUF945 family protein [Rhodoferax sp. U11-2br]|uniref:DUF945 family protein n=1 Tax=Rhodoferax sp. U11-2br TaxID=2838878 RepID=UPI001BED1F98|nr:DUF945 family protein [Rhodoferax sp. U11-2br]MBT3069198.1 DUF945 family protein [Rhodoferax sp. U11-2br]